MSSFSCPTGQLFFEESAKVAKRRSITPKQYETAYQAFFCYAFRFAEAMQKRHTHLLFRVDPIVALNVAVATYDDIDRYKQYHLRNQGGMRADVVKRASYFVKWISKLRPIMIQRSDGVTAERDAGLLVNEFLAIAYATILIGTDPEINRRIKLRRKTHAELAYDLHYRDITDDALLTIFQMITTLARAGDENALIELGVA